MTTSGFSRARSWTRPNVLVLAAFTVIYLSLEVYSFRQKSATWDEPIHLAAGFAAVANGDYRVDPTHPPFLRIWAALPLLAMRVSSDTSEIDRTPIADWLTKAYAFAHRFLYVEHDADRLLYAARFMVAIWGVVLGVLLFCWAREWLGRTPAIVALAFYTIEPNIAAHAKLVTTDLAVTCFIFATLYFLWRTCRRGSIWNLAALAVSFALAVVTKFSAILLGPIVILLLAAAAGWGPRMGLKRATAIVSLLVAGSFVGVWAAYGFRYAPSASNAWLLLAQDYSVVRERLPVLVKVLGWVDAHQLLPNVFTQGFLLGQSSAETFPAYLAGTISETGFWYYFPAAFLLKTPAALILFFLAGLFVFVWRRRKLGLHNELFVMVPMLVYLAFAIASGINIGVRHILPIYPFVILTAAAAAGELLAWRKQAGRIILGGMMAFWLAMFVHAYPHTLTFFNLAAGGPRNGLAWLAESNLDWGQDLKLLKSWMDRKQVAHVNLAYFGTADPKYYQIDCTHLPGAPFFAGELIRKPKLPGYVAISKTLLSGLYLKPEWRVFYSGFKARSTVADIGNSIRVYWVEEWPEETSADGTLADALAFGLEWPDRAIPHYRAILERRGDDSVTTTKLGIALLETGRAEHTEEAIATLRHAAELDPNNGEAQSQLAMALLDLRRLGEALPHAQEAARLMPQEAVVHDVLGLALAGAGKLDAAESSFLQALQLRPDDEVARSHLRQLKDWRRQ
jgi:tetratricopeptide (TPR) repeat protein